MEKVIVIVFIFRKLLNELKVKGFERKRFPYEVIKKGKKFHGGVLVAVGNFQLYLDILGADPNFCIDQKLSNTDLWWWFQNYSRIKCLKVVPRDEKMDYLEMWPKHDWEDRERIIKKSREHCRSQVSDNEVLGSEPEDLVISTDPTDLAQEPADPTDLVLTEFRATIASQEFDCHQCNGHPGCPIALENEDDVLCNLHDKLFADEVFGFFNIPFRDQLNVKNAVWLVVGCSSFSLSLA
jgi:hypothetical protein